jgi:ketosteroid isomerase-like protein
MPFSTPEEAEDAYYDALETGDLEALLGVWADDDKVACALPMTALVTGRSGVEKAYRDLLGALRKIDLEVHHLTWLKLGDTAVHLLEEVVTDAPGDAKPPPVYATNVYTSTGNGWRLVLHQNSPTPPRPGTPMGGAAGAASSDFPHLP